MLNGWSIYTFIVFVTVIILTIRTIHVPVPKIIAVFLTKCLIKCRIIKTAPPFGVLLLLATTAINGDTVRLGIVGQDGVRPYDVLVLFISLAYIAIALDTTGALRALAFYIAQRGGKSQSGIKLHFSLYVFFFAFGCIVGNDPIILSGTAFLAYFTRVAGLHPPLTWTLTEFIAANTASAVLVPSNPTNVLVSGAFSLNFLTGFTKWTILPSVIPAIVIYPILLVMFKKAYPQSIPKRVAPPDVNPRTALIDPSGAIFHGSLMLITLATLVGTSFVPDGAVSVWMVTFPALVVAFSRDVITDSFRKQPQTITANNVKADLQSNLKTAESDQKLHSLPVNGTEDPKLLTPEEVQLSDQNGDVSSPNEDHQFPPVAQSYPTPRTFSSFLRRLSHRFPTTVTTVSRLPIPILPFAMGMFILVQALLQRGWIDVFARGFARVCTTPATAAFFIGYMTVILCPVCGTNIGTTILMVEILRTPYFTSKDPQTLKAALYAVAMGSNLGAFSFTFTGSLAGLLWRGLLRQKGIIVTNWQFGSWNIIPCVLQTTIACAIIVGQVYWFQ